MNAVLNVGGGSKNIAISPHYAGWRHDLLDIDPRGNPDVVKDARELCTLPPAAYDAIYCSHNLEHYHRHHVTQVIRGFHHVLKLGGFAEIHVPDLGTVLRHVVQNNMDLDDQLYISALGPILVRDVIYGYHVEIEKSGQDFYAHKTGFTARSLARIMQEGGFPIQAIFARSTFELSGYFFKQPPAPELMKLLRINPAAVKK